MLVFVKVFVIKVTIGLWHVTARFLSTSLSKIPLQKHSEHLQSSNCSLVYRGPHKAFQPRIILLLLSKQVVSALQHVSVMRYIHRNVKASNVLVDSCLNCKLSGFGHARKMDETGKYREQEGIVKT